MQVLVYAGAVMVLFLFIIMLLDVNKDSSDLLKDKMTLGASITGLTLLVILTVSVFA
ncbi:MAG: NADH-quinone oxidoreductase subunit J, partial [Pseudomonadota bacterium]